MAGVGEQEESRRRGGWREAEQVNAAALRLERTVALRVSGEVCKGEVVLVAAGRSRFRRLAQSQRVAQGLCGCLRATG